MSRPQNRRVGKPKNEKPKKKVKDPETFDDFLAGKVNKKEQIFRKQWESKEV